MKKTPIDLSKPLHGQATDEQIASWKKEHPGGIYALRSGDQIAYFKEPSLDDVNCAMAKANQDVRSARDAIDHLHRYVELLFFQSTNKKHKR